MRSEERSGIVFILVLLLWGTPIMEPFRIFAEYIWDFTGKIDNLIKINNESMLGIVLSGIIMTVFCVLMLLLTKTNFVTAIAPVAIQITIILFVLSIVKNSIFDVKRMSAYLVLLAVISLIFALKRRTILIWLSDFYVFSLPVFLISGFFLKNFKAMRFITGKQTENLISLFDGKFGISGILWGLFITILILLPIIYNIPGRQK